MHRRMACFTWVVLALAFSAAPVDAWEKISVPVPAGWHFQFNESRGDLKAKVYLPQGQTVLNHTESLWIWTFLGANEQKPEAVLRAFVKTLNQCPSIVLKESRPFKDRGYEAVYATGYMPSINTCYDPPPLTADKGEVARFKFLRGNDNAYIIIRAWRAEPFKKQELAKVPRSIQDGWDRYFEEVYLYESTP